MQSTELSVLTAPNLLCEVDTCDDISHQQMRE